ncbi:molybdate ABC transporter substrate-binding protein [Amycolatopsis antarctica]|uniref:Molybdate ABC transporter substrate-binding protein n=1 Tax=Amycolatopsis antarctica TaxID=1854586 RepID=A0A263CZ11_9PSEU|nr:molybdate ABC transporter substrate-binding protein [Amycolatopsis antarctica]OZM70546.1 molybdate ABC transporter substrate-binding protein [Amycolatopsis antarctica]
MRKTVVALSALALFSTACGAAGGDAEGAADDGAGAPRTLTVFAAASLTESFGALEKRFEAEHPGVDVTLNLGASSKLAQQIDEGAAADVFASADEKNMEKVTAAGRADGEPAVFATNTLTIAVPPGNPKGVRGFADLAQPGLTLVVCAPQVPCGSAAETVEKSAGVALTPVSEEQDVKGVLAKVQAGEADAGLVYVTDATSAAGKVEKIDFPEAAGAVNRYPIAVLTDAPQADLAREFTEFVRGAAGTEELGKVGFGRP